MVVKILESKKPLILSPPSLFVTPRTLALSLYALEKRESMSMLSVAASGVCGCRGASSPRVFLVVATLLLLLLIIGQHLRDPFDAVDHQGYDDAVNRRVENGENGRRRIDPTTTTTTTTLERRLTTISSLLSCDNRPSDPQRTMFLQRCPGGQRAGRGRGNKQYSATRCRGRLFPYVLHAEAAAVSAASVIVDIAVGSSYLLGGATLESCASSSAPSICDAGLPTLLALARARHRDGATAAAAGSAYFAAFVPVLDVKSVLVGVHPLRTGVNLLLYESFNIPAFLPDTLARYEDSFLASSLALLSTANTNGVNNDRNGTVFLSSPSTPRSRVAAGMLLNAGKTLPTEHPWFGRDTAFITVAPNVYFVSVVEPDGDDLSRVAMETMVQSQQAASPSNASNDLGLLRAAAATSVISAVSLSLQGIHIDTGNEQKETLLRNIGATRATVPPAVTTATGNGTTTTATASPSTTAAEAQSLPFTVAAAASQVIVVGLRRLSSFSMAIDIAAAVASTALGASGATVVLWLMDAVPRRRDVPLPAALRALRAGGSPVPVNRTWVLWHPVALDTNAGLRLTMDVSFIRAATGLSVSDARMATAGATNADAANGVLREVASSLWWPSSSSSSTGGTGVAAAVVASKAAVTSMVPFSETVANFSSRLPVPSRIDNTSSATDEDTLPLALYSSQKTLVQAEARLAKLYDPAVGSSVTAVAPTFVGAAGPNLCNAREVASSNLAVDAWRNQTGADVAFQTACSSSQGTTAWAAGLVTASMVFAMSPYPDTLCTGRILGLHLWEVLSFAFNNAAFTELTMANHSEFNFQTSGLQLVVDAGVQGSTTLPIQTSRLASIKVRNRRTQAFEPLQRLDYYTFVTTSYVCEEMNAELSSLLQPRYANEWIEVSTSRSIQRTIMDYLTVSSPIRIVVDGRVTVTSIPDVVNPGLQPQQQNPTTLAWRQTREECEKAATSRFDPDYGTCFALPPPPPLLLDGHIAVIVGVSCAVIWLSIVIFRVVCSRVGLLGGLAAGTFTPTATMALRLLELGGGVASCWSVWMSPSGSFSAAFTVTYTCLLVLAGLCIMTEVAALTVYLFAVVNGNGVLPPEQAVGWRQFLHLTGLVGISLACLPLVTLAAVAAANAPSTERGGGGGAAYPYVVINGVLSLVASCVTIGVKVTDIRDAAMRAFDKVALSLQQGATAARDAAGSEGDDQENDAAKPAASSSSCPAAVSNDPAPPAAHSIDTNDNVPSSAAAPIASKTRPPSSDEGVPPQAPDRNRSTTERGARRPVVMNLPPAASGAPTPPHAARTLLAARRISPPRAIVRLDLMPPRLGEAVVGVPISSPSVGGPQDHPGGDATAAAASADDMANMNAPRVERPQGLQTFEASVFDFWAPVSTERLHPAREGTLRSLANDLVVNTVLSQVSQQEFSAIVLPALARQYQPRSPPPSTPKRSSSSARESSSRGSSKASSAASTPTARTPRGSHLRHLSLPNLAAQAAVFSVPVVVASTGAADDGGAPHATIAAAA